MEKLRVKNIFKTNYHEIPSGSSSEFHGIFLDLELRKIFFRTFFSGINYYIDMYSTRATLADNDMTRVDLKHYKDYMLIKDPNNISILKHL
jgi:hypothetical protein